MVKSFWIGAGWVSPLAALIGANFLYNLQTQKQLSAEALPIGVAGVLLLSLAGTAFGLACGAWWRSSGASVGVKAGVVGGLALAALGLITLSASVVVSTILQNLRSGMIPG